MGSEHPSRQKGSDAIENRRAGRRAGGPLRTGSTVLGVVGAALALPGCAQTSVSAPPPCAPHVVDGVVPTWAQGGFSVHDPVMHYETSVTGRIVALLFAFPLEAPPPVDHNNKILWVSRLSVRGTPLTIDARRMVGTRAVGQTVHRQVAGGPGPSIIDLPSAGCWRFEMHWSGHADRLDVDYVPRPAG